MRRRAFTLVEFIIVVALLAILIALLLPAVQKVRDSAARMKCQNNVRQWALAMHQYQDANGSLPFGSKSSPRQTWVMHLWPFIEQSALAEKNNYANSFNVPPATIPGTMDGLCAKHVSIYYCPADNLTDQDGAGVLFERTRGNYVVNWGNTKYGAPTTGGQAPFGHQKGIYATPTVVSLTSISDGTSNTLLVSEYLINRSSLDDDWRGDIHNDQGVFRFNTLTTPNSKSPDSVYWAIGFDPLMPYINNWSQYNAARSRHFGGVNASFCDGSVRFISNNITQNVWSAMGTMNGAEPISE